MSSLSYILIVDDHVGTANSLKKALSKHRSDWEVKVATNAAAAKEVINQNPLDAVVTDWKFSETKSSDTGFDIIKAALKKDPLCVTILVTGFGEEFDRYKDAFALGVYDCISKTQTGVVVSREIAYKLEAALERRQLHREANFYARHIDKQLRVFFGTDSAKAKLTNRWLSIMFTDIRGFSKVTEQLREHRNVLSDFLRSLYGTIVACGHRYEGVVDKFLGDGAMLLFGVLDADGSARNYGHAKNAVEAALEIKRTGNELLEQLREDARRVYAGSIDPLSMGIGINTAEVLVGIVHTEDRDQFTALGHGVNLAQRFESMAGRTKGKYRYGDILITSTVEGRLRDQFELKHEPSVEDLHNIHDRHDVWSVQGESGLQFPLPGARKPSL